MDSILSKVGIIGGASHYSSDSYLPEIHRIVNQERGGYYNAEILQYDVNYADLYADIFNGNWEDVGYYLGDIAESLVMAGMRYVTLASNTLHRVIPDIEARIGQEKIIHLGDCIARRCLEDLDACRTDQQPSSSAQHVLLLGTLETMTGDSMRQRLVQHGLTVHVPDHSAMRTLDNYISDELRHGTTTATAQQWLIYMVHETLQQASQDGYEIEAVIFGSNELSTFHGTCEPVLRLENQHLLTVVDAKRAHIASIAQACLGEWHNPSW